LAAVEFQEAQITSCLNVLCLSFLTYLIQLLRNYDVKSAQESQWHGVSYPNFSVIPCVKDQRLFVIELLLFHI
jgi:hypothetical protein